eukprot:gnl/Dysnectes_brevis/1639_a1865_2943.p1 GENE.gnl/Dysnectes_brevis/1639_a1865_2943~~gnl/Dysnectes_brevis/1639_a1865_2943.p1  ORF type:complete len:332 (+),score=98.14 gnl/Dysnectes_brevis/1639_a1865_2943:52-1047(+)
MRVLQTIILLTVILQLVSAEFITKPFADIQNDIGDKVVLFIDSTENQEAVDLLTPYSEMYGKALQIPFYIVDRQDEANEQIFSYPDFEALPRLFVLMNIEMRAEVMPWEFNDENIDAFLALKFMNPNPDLEIEFTNEEDVLDLHQTSQTPVVIRFQREECPHCASFDRAFLRAVTRLDGDFHFTSVDCDSTLDSQTYCAKMTVFQFPTVLILHEGVYTEYDGSGTTIDLEEWLHKEVSPSRQAQRIEEALEKSRNPVETEATEGTIEHEEIDPKSGLPKHFPPRANPSSTRTRVTELEERVARLEEQLAHLAVLLTTGDLPEHEVVGKDEL